MRLFERLGRFPPLAFLAASMAYLTASAVAQYLPVTQGNVSTTDVFDMLPFAGRNYLNWSDLPFKISATQSLGYNDNILGLPQGFSVPSSTPRRGDFFSTTIFGASTKLYLGPQQFFADGSYGLTRYLIDSSDNTHQYSLDAGVNWNVTSRCSGRLIAAVNEYQSLQEEQVGSGINTVNSKSLNETAKCLISGYISGIVDSGLSSNTNSTLLNQANNYDSKFVRSGLSYDLTSLDSFSALTTFTNRQFTGRPPNLVLPMSGLASAVDQIDYQLSYQRLISPFLTFNGMAGITQLITFSRQTTNSQSTQYQPVYSASLAWQATPKLSFSVSSQRSVGAPSSVIANAEISNSQSVTAAYLLSPKLSFQTGLAKSTNTGSSGSIETLASATTNSISAYAKLNYTITPFVSASLSDNYSDRDTLGVHTKDNMTMLSLNYRPQ